jgi:membrane-bound inhibitor of C-type lysozyme
VRTAVGLFLGLFASPLAADVITATYDCDRGVTVPVTYVNGDEIDSVAVLNLEGRQITLIQEMSGSGARYGWPSGGSGYVWWSKGDAATLYWRDGETTIEEVLYSECQARD